MFFNNTFTLTKISLLLIFLLIETKQPELIFVINKFSGEENVVFDMIRRIKIKKKAL